jgi:hypothetical protein
MAIPHNRPASVDASPIGFWLISSRRPRRPALELAQRGLRARIKTLLDAAGFALDQAAHRHGNQVLSGSSFGSVERTLALDGENSLLDLMRKELAVPREYCLRQESPAVHP